MNIVLVIFLLLSNILLASPEGCSNGNLSTLENEELLKDIEKIKKASGKKKRKPISSYMKCTTVNIKVSRFSQENEVSSISKPFDLLFSKSQRKKRKTEIGFDHVSVEDGKREELMLEAYILSEKKPKLHFRIKNKEGKILHKEKFLFRRSNKVKHNVPYYLTKDEFYIEKSSSMKRKKDLKIDFLIECYKKQYHPSLKNWPYYEE